MVVAVAGVLVQHALVVAARLGALLLLEVPVPVAVRLAGT